MKKLLQGDCSWAIQKLILGWIVDTVAKTLSLPPHKVERLQEILNSLPATKKRISIRKWHKVLGELRSMSLALPGSRGLFSELQLALQQKKKGRVNLQKGLHGILDDFRYLLKDISNRPTRIAELIPLAPSLQNYHDASGTMAGGVLLPSAHAIHRHPSKAPVIWRCFFPTSIQKELVTDKNPNGSITNSDLELMAAVISNDAAAQNFNVQERTILSHTDNSPTMYWLRKGSTTSNSARAHLLRAQALHQRFHRYVAQIDFIPGVENSISDLPSRSAHLTDNELLHFFDSHFPQPRSWRLWTPPQKLLSALTSCLHRKTFNMESLLHEPRKCPATGPIGAPSAPSSYPSIPIYQLSKTLLPSFKSLQRDFGTVVYPTSGDQFAQEQLRMPYGRLDKRSAIWGPRTLAPTCKAK